MKFGDVTMAQVIRTTVSVLRCNVLKFGFVVGLLFALLPNGASADTFDETIDAGFDAILMGKYETLSQFLEDRASADDPMALYALGIMHQHGSLVGQDIQKAIALYRRSARLDCSEAKIAASTLQRSLYFRNNTVSVLF